MAETNYVINLTGVSKKYKLFNSKTDRMKEALHPLKKNYHKDFFALNNVNLKVKQGEILGIVGMNGSGKSTLLKIIAGIVQPSSGKVNVIGNVVPLLELGSGFNPEFTGLENIYFYNSIMGYTRKETDSIVDKILEFAEIGEFINQPVKTYSSGMQARLSFAVSVNINPDILIVDEVLSVGDELFKRKSFSRIEEFFRQGKTILFVSHSIQSINQLCTRAIMLYKGAVIIDGSTSSVTRFYQRFLFSQPEQRNELISELKDNFVSENYENEILLEEGSEMPAIISPTTPDKVPLKSYFVENFLPRSTDISKSVELEIVEFRIENENGDQVNHMFLDEKYRIIYEILFKEDIGQINLGLSIRTTFGVAVSWRLYPGESTYLPQNYKENDRIVASYLFTCKFIPETYFVVLSLRRNAPEGKELIFRAVDYYAFTVVSDKKHDKGGYFDADFIIDVS